jgi:Ran GTPase-activating protein (RanGAP) involved in mRNA processing and transport
MGDEGA